MRKVFAILLTFAIGLVTGMAHRWPGAAAAPGSLGGGGGGVASPCGDLNADGLVDISDAVALLAWLFQGGNPPKCPSCCQDKPDLTVVDIDVNSISVNCPGGPGTCETTVTFTIANTGGAAAGPFRIHIAFDPLVDTSVPVAGLAPGASLTMTVTSPVGGNCFDPDCTICVTVDSEGQVDECNEADNRLCVTRQG